MDEIEVLRQMRSDVPPPSPRSLGTARAQLVQERTPRWRSRLLAITGLRRVPRQPLMRMAAGLSLALVVAASVLAVRADHSGGSPATPGSARLAAWTVTRQANGVLRIYMRQLRDPAGLRAQLRRDGVPARIEFAHHPIGATTGDVFPRSCHGLRMSDAANSKLQEKIFPPPFGPPDKNGVMKARPWVLAIRPSAIPAGVGMFWQVWIVRGASMPFTWNLNLVQASPDCTGS